MKKATISFRSYQIESVKDYRLELDFSDGRGKLSIPITKYQFDEYMQFTETSKISLLPNNTVVAKQELYR